MLKTVFRRLSGNRWKVLSLLIGLILAISIAFSIPVYSNAILQRILIKTMEESQISTGEYPAYVSLDHRPAGVKKNFDNITSLIEEQFSKIDASMPADVLVSGKMLKFEMFRRQIPETKKYDNLVLTYLRDFESHVHLLSGRMFDPTRSDGVVEVVVSNRKMVKSLLTMDQVYEYESLYTDEKDDPLKITIVGVVEPDDPSDLFWRVSFDDILGGMFVPQDFFLQKMAANMDYARHVTQFSYYTALDYHTVRTDTASLVPQIYNETREKLNESLPKNLLQLPVVESIESFLADSETVNSSMYILTVPIFILLGFYIIMVSRLKLESEQNEISVMQSRGASRWYILCLYLIESLILMAVAVVLGPLVGRLLCSVIGASNGFLEFVNRKALDFRIVPEAYAAVAATALLFIVITMIPAFLSAGVNIVQSKRAKHKKKIPFYHKYFLDILLLAVGCYGFYTMETERRAVAEMLEEGTVTQTGTDLLTYLSCTLFALGAGMLFLRVYPLIVKLVFRLGRRIWPSWAYAAISRVARNRDNSYIMLFLIATIAVGIFNTDAAQSINSHIEKNVRATAGADLEYWPVWKMYDLNGNQVRGTVEPGTSLVKIYDEGELVQTIKVTYFELLTQSFEGFPEIESIARVYQEDSITVRGNSSTMQDISAMYIDPYEFGTVAFSTANMNTYHLNEYLNIMSVYEDAVVVSNNIMKQLELKPGDSLLINNGTGAIECTIIAGVDSWPGYEKYYETDSGKVRETSFVVGNLSKIFFETEVRPYCFWIRRAEGYSDLDVYHALEQSEFGVRSLESADLAIVEQKNMPILQGTNGLLSVSFLSAIVICALGFMNYWLISIKSRTLQFGISRALGMSKAGIFKMLLCEQILVSGVAVAAGVIIGKIGSTMFVPILASHYTSVEDIVPFKVVATQADLVRICVIIGVMLVLCIGILATMVIRQKIDRAIKLGDE